MAEIVTLQEVYSLTDFATDNLWYMDFIKMPTTSFNLSANELNMRCQSFSVPSTSVKDLSFTLHNHVKHQSTITVQPQEVTIPFVETQDMNTTKWLIAWREVCSRTNTNYVSLPEQRRATIQFYTYTGQQNINYTYKIEWCELRDIGSISYNDGSNPTAILRQVKLQCGAVYDNDELIITSGA